MNESLERILVVVTPLTPTGGGIRRLELWSRHGLGHRPLPFLCHATSDIVIDLLEEAGAAVTHTPGLSRASRILLAPAVRVLNREIHRRRPDVIISMYLWANVVTDLTMAYRRSKGLPTIPHIVHIAGDPVPPSHHPAVNRLYRSLIRRTLRRADAIVVLSKREARQYAARLDLDSTRIHVIPIGIEFVRRPSKRSVHSPIRFGVVARLSREKRIDLIVNAFDRVLGDGRHPAELHIYGDGDERTTIQSRANRAHNGSHIFLHGWIDSPVHAYRDIDCLLMFSDTEGTPRSIMEAGREYVPSIARAVGGVEDIILDGVTGNVVHTYDEMEHRIAFAAAHPDRILAMGHKAREFFKNQHSIEREVRHLNRLAFQLANGNGRYSQPPDNHQSEEF